MLEVRRHSLPARHPDVATAQVALARCLLDLGRMQEAEALLREARAALVAESGADDKRVREVDELLARARRPAS
jgi:hypothetical protein